MKTYFDIIRDVSNLRWSINDPDPTSFAEVQKSVKLAIAQANSFIWSLNDFPFKIKKDALILNKGQNVVLAPKGTLLEVWIDGDKSYLTQISAQKADFLSITEYGKPNKYWVEFGDKGAQIHFYPMPFIFTSLNLRFEYIRYSIHYITFSNIITITISISIFRCIDINKSFSTH